MLKKLQPESRLQLKDALNPGCLQIYKCALIWLRSEYELLQIFGGKGKKMKLRFWLHVRLQQSL